VKAPDKNRGFLLSFLLGTLEKTAKKRHNGVHE